MGAIVALSGVLCPSWSSAASGEEVTSSTTATIHRGLLGDNYPGAPPRGSTDLYIPYYGRIKASQPACETSREWEFGRIYPGGDFSPIAGPGEDEGGKWLANIFGKATRPETYVVRVLPDKRSYKGVAYLCEEVTSEPLLIDRSDFSKCEIAKAEWRGYVPGIKLLRHELNEAKAKHNDDEVRRIEDRLRSFRNRREALRRTAHSCSSRM